MIAKIAVYARIRLEIEYLFKYKNMGYRGAENYTEDTENEAKKYKDSLDLLKKAAASSNNEARSEHLSDKFRNKTAMLTLATQAEAIKKSVDIKEDKILEKEKKESIGINRANIRNEKKAIYPGTAAAEGIIGDAKKELEEAYYKKDPDRDQSAKDFLGYMVNTGKEDAGMKTEKKLKIRSDKE